MQKWWENHILVKTLLTVLIAMVLLYSEKSGFNLQKVEKNMWSCFYELPLEKEKLATVLSVFLRLLFLPADTSLLPPTINHLQEITGTSE